VRPPVPGCGFEVVRSSDGAFVFDVGSSRLFAARDVLADILEAEATGRDAGDVNEAHGEAEVTRARLELAQVRGLGLLALEPSRDADMAVAARPSCCRAIIFLTERREVSRTSYVEIRSSLRSCAGMGIEWIPLRRSLDYVFRVFGAGYRAYGIHFVIDESLLAFDLLRQATDYCHQLSRRLRVDVDLAVSARGTPVTPEITTFLTDNKFRVHVGLDDWPLAQRQPAGPPAKAGASAPTAGGADVLLGTGGLWVERSAVLSPCSTDVVHLFRQAFEKPARAISFTLRKVRHGHPLAIKEREAEWVKRSYAALADHLTEQAMSGDLQPLTALLGGNDCLGRLIRRIVQRERSTRRCGAGKDMLAVGVDGRLYPCAGLIGRREWAMGMITRLPDERVREKFLDQHVDKRRGCSECWGRYVCGGGCYAHAAISNGAIDRPDPCECKLTQHLMRLAVTVVGRLQQDDPELLPQLVGTISKRAPVPDCEFAPGTAGDSPLETDASTYAGRECCIADREKGDTWSPNTCLNRGA